jgi:FAD/FMN-containing dehydrogenase
LVLHCSKVGANNGPLIAYQENAMHATHSFPLPAPRVYSAVDLCKAMLAGAVLAGRFDASGLDRVLCHDPQRGALEVQAGTPWHALAAHGGSAFAATTVGESVAANASGPDGRPMVVHLRSVTLVTADGELRRVSRDCSLGLFSLAVGGFGVFGPFYSVTLDLASLAQAASAASAPVRLELPEAPAGGACSRIDLLAPPEASEPLIARVRAALGEHRYALTRLEVRRALPEDETFLRWARHEHAALRIEFQSRATLGGCVGATQLRAQLIDLALAAGGAIAPASLPAASRTQAAACYPMLGNFLAEKRRHDPSGRVTNAWYRGARDLWRHD